MNKKILCFYYRYKLLIFLIIGLVSGLLLLGGVFLTGNYLDEQNYYLSAEKEYTSLNGKIYSTSDDISEIESRYSNEDGFFSLYKFTKEDLDNYADSINEQQQNYGNLINWVIDNDKYLRHTGKSDLSISEQLTEWRSIKKGLEDREIKIVEAKTYKETLDNYNGLLDGLLNFSSFS